MERLWGDDRKHRPERATRQLSQLPGLDVGIPKRHKAHNFHERPFRQYSRDLGLAVMGNRQRIALTSIPLPQRWCQRQFQGTTRDLVKPPEELSLVL